MVSRFIASFRRLVRRILRRFCEVVVSDLVAFGKWSSVT
jgi:hypothetical protein